MFKDKIILAVDDEVFNLQLIEEFLGKKYTIIQATNGQEALERIQQTMPDLILLDISMPVMDGLEFLKKFKPVLDKKHIPVIILTGFPDRDNKLMALSLGCWDFISKPIDFVELELRVKNALELKSYKDSLEEKIIQRTKELKEAYNKIKKTQLEIVRKLGKAAEFRDDETGEHIIRTSKYVQILARELGLPSNECELFYYAAPMHDIGKIGIPDMILLKPGQLTKEEFEIVKLHTIIGAEILSGTDLPLLEKAKEVALTHHEKWDGTGYPEGLKGEEIPLYKKAWPLEKALDYIKENAGAHFDPDLVMVFFEALDEILTVRKQYQKPSAKPKLIDILEKIKEYHTKTLKTS
jgi:putative two-component system response regulator